jgi:hypothetical protein
VRSLLLILAGLFLNGFPLFDLHNLRIPVSYSALASVTCSQDFSIWRQAANPKCTVHCG